MVGDSVGSDVVGEMIGDGGEVVGAEVVGVGVGPEVVGFEVVAVVQQSEETKGSSFPRSSPPLASCLRRGERQREVVRDTTW